MRRIATTALWLSVLGAAACSAQTTASSQPATVSMTINKKVFVLEIAADDASREHGLMNRPSMPADHGMIFIFPKADQWSFWMKNTLINLDLVWLDASGKIVDMTTLKSKDETGYVPRRAAIYVIELNEGVIKELGLKRGDTLAVPEKLPDAK